MPRPLSTRQTLLCKRLSATDVFDDIPCTTRRVGGGVSVVFSPTAAGALRAGPPVGLLLLG